jgi:hypothetical protein
MDLQHGVIAAFFIGGERSELRRLDALESRRRAIVTILRQSAGGESQP